MNDRSSVRNNLLNYYPAETQGTWEIFGEDPNCDLGGFHEKPLLARVTGTYLNVVDHAIALPGFFQWGRGGYIKKVDVPVNIVNVDSLTDPQVIKLKAEKERLQLRISGIDKELKLLITK